MSRRISTIDAACDELRRNGATLIGFEAHHKHPRVLYLWRGRKNFYVCSGTPSDVNAGRAVRRDIRKILGVASVKEKSHRPNRNPRILRRTIVKKAEPLILTPAHDGFATLREHEHYDTVRRQHYREAWAQYWEDVKISMGMHGPWLENK